MQCEYKFYMATYKKEIAQRVTTLLELPGFSGPLTTLGKDGWRLTEINSVAMDFGIVYTIIFERAKQ